MRGIAVALAVVWAGSLAVAATPATGAASAPAAHAPRASAPAKAPAQKLEPAKAPIDINTASRAQLKTLPGIGDAEADRIIAGRPYKTKTDLVSTQAIPAGTYLSIKRLIVALPPKKRSTKG